MGNGLKFMKVHLNIRRDIFTPRVVKHWNKLPSEVVESLSLEILQT